MKRLALLLLLLIPWPLCAQTGNAVIIQTPAAPAVCSPLTLYIGTGAVAGNMWFWSGVGSGCTLTGAGGGVGTVTSFSAGNLAPLFTTNVATPVSTPALTFTLDTTSQHFFLGRQAAGVGVPSYLRPVCGDLSDAGALCQSAGPLPSSIVNPGSNFLTAYTAGTGTFSQAQPACGNLSDASGGCSMSTTAGGDLSGTLPSPNVASTHITGATNTDLVAFNATGNLVNYAGASACSAGPPQQFFTGLSAAGASSCAAPTNNGTVTSVATSSPITGGPITGSGTIACATCVTSAAALTSNAVIIGGGLQASSTISASTTTTNALFATAGAPAFRNIAATDLPAANRVSSFGATFDGGGSALATATAYVTVQAACTIVATDSLIDTGTATFTFWRLATGTTALPAVGNSISTAGIALSSGNSLHTDASDFTSTAVAKDDKFGIHIVPASSATWAQIVVECTR